MGVHFKDVKNLSNDDLVKKLFDINDLDKGSYNHIRSLIVARCADTIRDAMNTNDTNNRFLQKWIIVLTAILTISTLTAAICAIKQTFFN